MQPWHTPFSIFNQSIVPFKLLTVTSWPANRFLRKQVRWSDIPISFRIFQILVVIYRVKGFSIGSEVEIDIFLEFHCFLHDPTNVGNLISGSLAFSKPSLYIWNFSVHNQLKPCYKDFGYYLASTWNELNYMVVWSFPGIA